MSIVELSKKLFVLPNARILTVPYVLLAFSSFLIDLKALLFFITLTVTIACSIKLLKLRFNIRRLLFLSILVSLLSFFSFSIFDSFSGSFFLLLAVIYFCSERGLVASALVSAIPFLILEPQSLPIILLSATFFLLYLQILSVKVKNSTLREFVESFVKFWLTNNSKYAEETLKRNSELFKGRVRCLTINNFRLISTDFHPGPFRNVGGAKLINFLDSQNSAYLHSPTSHERDPVSEEDLRAIRDALSCNGIEMMPGEPFELESDNFKVFCFPFDKMRLIFVSGKRKIDDFLLDSKNFVVDCHNANFFGELNESEIAEIRELVRRAEKAKFEPARLVKGSCMKINARSESISNYISAILFDYSSVKFAIVIFDSNNVDVSFRELVERKFGELGFKAIICSTDNHSNTGLRVKESYKPAGACEEDYKFLDLLLEKVRNAEFENLFFRYAESRVEARIIGGTLKEIEVLANRSGKYVYLFFIFVFLSFLLAPLSKVI